MKISIKAIFIAYFISLILGFAVSTSYSLSYVNVISELSEEKQKMLGYLMQAIHFIICMLSGYIAASIAKTREIHHGLILGLFSWIASTAIRYSIFVQHDLAFDLLKIDTLINLLFTTSGCTLGAFIKYKIAEKKNGAESESPLEQKIENLGND